MASQIDREQAFRDTLNEIYPTVTMGSMEWDPADVLETMDPIAFRCEVNDYESAQLSDGVWFEWEDGNIYDEEEDTEEEDTDDDE
jgi:hypothetical protein